MLQIERYNVLFQAEGLVTGMKRPDYTVKCQMGFTHLLMKIPLTYLDAHPQAPLRFQYGGLRGTVM